MKTVITTLLTFLLTIGLQAQMPGKLQAAMGKTMSGFNTARSADDFATLSNSFKRIADAESHQWLPRYYEAHTLIIGNFRSQDAAADRDARLDMAQEAIDKLRTLEADNAEVEVLQAFLYTSRLVIDPMSRGQEMGMKSSMAIGKALSMDPTNPRARYMQIANERGTAQFFGKDLSVFCAQAKALLEDWDEAQGEHGAFYPSWGKEETQGIATACEEG